MKQNKFYLLVFFCLIIAQVSKAEDSVDSENSVSENSEIFQKYNYDPTGRRDPFQPFKFNSNLKLSLTSPLEKWDIEEFSIIGILWGGKEPRAMIKDPDGQMHTVNRKTKIGKNNGQVIKIREGEIVVLETSEIDGEVRHETRTIEMKK